MTTAPIETATSAPSSAGAMQPMDGDRLTLPFDPHDLWRTLSAQRWLIAVCAVLVVAAAALYSFTATPYYRATLRVLIERNSDRVVGFEEIYNLATGSDDYYVTQYRILESRAVAETALQLLPAADRDWFAQAKDPVQAMLDLRHIQPVPKSRLVDVETEHPDPDVAHRMADALVQAYVDNVSNRQTQASRSALEQLQAESQALQKKLVDAENAAQEFKRRHKLIATKDHQSLVAARLEKLSEELAEVERERRGAETHLQSAERAVADAAFSDDLPEVLESRVVGDHKRELLQAQQEHSALSQSYKPMHPRLKAATRKIKAVEARLTAEVDAITQGIRRRHERLRQHEDEVRVRLEKQGDLLLELERKTIEYQILKNEADNVRRTHDTIIARLKEVEIINDHQASNVHPIGAAEVSGKPVRPRKLLNLALAALCGLLLGTGVAFAADALDRSIKTPAEAQRVLGLPVLGLVPHLEGRREHRGKVDPETFDPRSSLSEAFRTIRTNFTFSKAGRDVRSLIVTSATPEEGKSLVSINLAVSMGRAGKRVLLVDADMRRPRLHRAFEIEAEEGLSSILVEAAKLEDKVIPTPADNVWLLPCGIIPPNPVELLGSEQAEKFLQTALAQFDFVLIDSPPVGLVSDACVLSSIADRVLFVVRSFKTPRGLCRRALGQLLGVGADMVGMALNHSDIRADRYGKHAYEYSYLSTYEYREDDADDE
ncbi:MAG: polysaccharide biosynthesis tyrosine autokinase [Planctomycetota bacterium]